MKAKTYITALVAIFIVAQSNVSFAKEVNPEPNKVLSPNDYCKVKGLFYTVQIGVYSSPINEDALPAVLKPVYCIQREDGLYSYFCGIYDSRFTAMEKRYDVVSKGYHDAYVAVYYDGEQISMPEADELIAEHGKDILYNAEEAEDNLTQKQGK